MKLTVILAVLEANDYSLDHSRSWKLVSALKNGAVPQVLSLGGEPLGTVSGVVPILQPVRCVIDGSSGFIIFMRAIFAVNSLFVTAPGTEYQININGTVVINARITQTSNVRKLGEFPTFVATLPTQNPPLSSTHSFIDLFVDGMAFSLWPEEPINWTTDRLYFTANQGTMSGHEMRLADIGLGIINISPAGISVSSGTIPAATINYRKNWSGAGRPTIVSASRIAAGTEQSGLSSCTGTGSGISSGSDSSSGGSFGSFSGSTGDGGIQP